MYTRSMSIYQRGQYNYFQVYIYMKLLNLLFSLEKEKLAKNSRNYKLLPRHKYIPPHVYNTQNCTIIYPITCFAIYKYNIIQNIQAALGLHQKKRSGLGNENKKKKKNDLEFFFLFDFVPKMK